MRRRSYLKHAGGLVLVAIAGCVEEDDNAEREQGGADDGSTTDSTDDTSGGNGRPIELLSHEWYNEGRYEQGVRGQIENVSDSTLDYVEVEVYFLDSEGVQFEEGLDNVTDLASGRIWEFDVMFWGDDPERVDSYEVQTDYSDY